MNAAKKVGLVLMSPCALLGGCGTGASIEHTNAQQTEQLNQIAENTSEGAGNAQAASSPADAAGQRLRAGAARPPRKY